MKKSLVVMIIFWVDHKIHLDVIKVHSVHKLTLNYSELSTESINLPCIFVFTSCIEKLLISVQNCAVSDFVS